MMNLDELIYSYKYIKGMIRVKRELDDNYIVTIPEDTRWFFIDDVAKDKAKEFRNNI